MPGLHAETIVGYLKPTSAALLLRSGVHPKLVQHLLGNASITMSLDRYSHWIPSMGRYTAEGMDGVLSYSLLLTKPATRTSGFLVFYGFCRKNTEPTSGLEPLT